MRVSGTPYRQGRNSYGDTTKFAIAIHNTSNDASAADEASYASRRTDGTSAHLYCDATTVVQSLDTRAKAGHAGSDSGNTYAIAVEITGSNGWTRDRWLRSVAWGKLGAALAEVIRAHWPDGSFKVRRATVAEMKANPRVKAFYSHDDMRRAWGGTDHTDPGPNFPWDRLIQVVRAALGKTPPAADPTEDDDMTPAEKWIQHVINYRLAGLLAGNVVVTVPGRVDLNPRYTTLTTPNRIAAGLLALAAAQEGLDTDAVLTRLDQHAAAEQQRDTELRTLVEQGLNGTLDAADVVQRMGALLAGQPEPG
jgi:N-acetyl-anhydromuramyl-L-alanine amidase AmpD